MLWFSGEKGISNDCYELQCHASCYALLAELDCEMPELWLVTYIGYVGDW
jgi:hypothetical protein